MKSLDLFMRQSRFDLIYKYLYAKNMDNSFIRNAYIESIYAFNNFNEYEWKDGAQLRVKSSCYDFLTQFDSMIHRFSHDNIQGGQISVPVSSNNYLLNGAHRLSILASLQKDVEVIVDNQNNMRNGWEYDFFKNQGMPQSIMDFGALEFVKMNPYSHIINLFPLADIKYDYQVEEILNRNGFIYYKKTIPNITYNAMVNLKKMHYSESGSYERWVGSDSDKFSGAQNHAKCSLGNGGSLRVYVFVCEDKNKLRDIKHEIRGIYNLGNYTVHINDTHTSDIELAQTYFNENSLHLINHLRYEQDDCELNCKIIEFKKRIHDINGNLDDFILVGSVPLNAYGIRKSRDFDFLAKDMEKGNKISDKMFSMHDSQLKYYPTDKRQMIENPKYHSFYKGVKILSLDTLLQMKQARNEQPKDVNDSNLIRSMI